MRILLVNFALRANHGGILQCYALQEVLKSMGHQVVKAEQKHVHQFRPSLHLLLAMPKRAFVRLFINRNSTKVFHEFYEDRKEYLPRKNAEKFIKKYLNTVRVSSLNELNGDDYDAVIVGSDQVWRKSYTDSLLTKRTASDNAFLAFTDGWPSKRIAYGISMGINKWEYTIEETKVLNELIKKFDAISVREDSATALLQRYLAPSVIIEHVLDPTLLLDKERYIDLFMQVNTPKSAGDLLVYILDPDEKKACIVSELASRLNLSPFQVNNPKFEKSQFPARDRIQTSIEQWLRGFYDAKYVIADSFHACVFSIIFEKPFVVIANESRGINRIDSLLRSFCLESRLIHNNGDLRIISQEIDWNTIKAKKELLAGKSIDFICHSLNINTNCN